MKKLIIYLVPLLLLVSCGKPKDEIQRNKTPEEIEQEKEAKRDDLEVSMVTTTEKGMEPTNSKFLIKYGLPGVREEKVEGEGTSFTRTIRVEKGEQISFYFKTGGFVENVKLSVKKNGKILFDNLDAYKPQHDGFNHLDFYYYR